MLGDVIPRGTQPSSHEHRPGTIERRTEGVLDGGAVIAHRCAPRDLDADRGERARNLRPVGIDGEAEEEFSTDGEELEFHAAGRTTCCWR